MWKKTKGVTMKVKRVVAGVVVAMMVSAVGFASEVDSLANLLAEKGIINYGEAQQVMTETKEASRSLIAQGKHDTLPYWIQNISMKGDLRLRHQIDWAVTGNTVRERERLRLRTGFDTRISENLKAGFGLATGSEKNLDAGAVTVSTKTGSGTATGTTIIDAEPTSTNHTFGNGFAKAMLMVDYAYLEYTPYSWAKVTGGKMKSGTQLWQTTDLQWDTDINPDGLAVNFTKTFGKVDTFLNASYLVVNELNSATQDNPDMTIIQPGASYNITDTINAKAAVAFEQFNVNGKYTGYYGTPAFDYCITAPSVNLAFKELLLGYSVNVFGDFTNNSDSKATTDTMGSAYGVKVGNEKIAGFGDWQATYLSRRLEANAWLNKLGDSDTYGGAVNTQGMEAIVSVGLTSATTLIFDYYSMDLIKNSTLLTPKTLLQCDVVYKF